MALKTLTFLFSLFAFFNLVAGKNEWYVESPEGISVRAVISEDEGFIPHSFTITLSANFPNTLTIDKEALRSHLLLFNGIYPPFHLIQEDVSDDKKTYSYTLEPLIAGSFPLSFFSIPFKTESGDTIEIISDFFFHIAKIPAIPEKPISYLSPLLPIETPVPLTAKGELRRQMIPSNETVANQAAFVNAHSLPWKGLLTAFIVLGVLLYYKFKLPKAGVHAHPINRSIESLAQSENLFQQLKSQPTPECTKELFETLINTIRFQIEDKYDVAAMTQTSDEFLQEIKEKAWLNDSQRILVQEFIFISDRVKFDRYTPSMPEAERAMELVKGICQASFA